MKWTYVVAHLGYQPSPEITKILALPLTIDYKQKITHSKLNLIHLSLDLAHEKLPSQDSSDGWHIVHCATHVSLGLSPTNACSSTWIKWLSCHTLAAKRSAGEFRKSIACK